MRATPPPATTRPTASSSLHLAHRIADREPEPCRDDRDAGRDAKAVEQVVGGKELVARRRPLGTNEVREVVAAPEPIARGRRLEKRRERPLGGDEHAEE